jgi:hypothetical protein
MELQEAGSDHTALYEIRNYIPRFGRQEDKSASTLTL